MGFDEAQLADGCRTPTLRFYTWAPDSLSLGYFQRLEDVPERATAGALVRRMTGGGAIHHVDELTFSITVPRGHRLYRGPVPRSYERVHAAIADALAVFDVQATLRGQDELASDRQGTGMCFHHSTSLDLVWNQRKGVGSAQRRRSDGILHHGSIKLGASTLDSGIATVHAVHPRVTAEELATELSSAFERSFGVRLEDGTVSEAERSEADERGRHFTSRAFVGRR